FAIGVGAEIGAGGDLRVDVRCLEADRLDQLRLVQRVARGGGLFSGRLLLAAREGEQHGGGNGRNGGTGRRESHENSWRKKSREKSECSLPRPDRRKAPRRACENARMSERLFVISAPSGAGKTSLVKALLQRLPGLRVSTSHTTRPPRPNEQDGREYYFVSPAQFQQLVDEQAFLEHAQVFDNFYGTSLGQLREKLAAGHDVILEIDWQGARQVRAALPGCCTIFILPPSLPALKARLN